MRVATGDSPVMQEPEQFLTQLSRSILRDEQLQSDLVLVHALIVLGQIGLDDLVDQLLTVHSRRQVHLAVGQLVQADVDRFAGVKRISKLILLVWLEGAELWRLVVVR